MVGPNAVLIHDLQQPVGGGEKRARFGGEVVPSQGSRSESAFPSSQRCCSERPGAVKGAPLLGAAERTLDGEDRSEMIAEEGKAGRKAGEKWSAKMVPSLAASNNSQHPDSGDS